MQLADGRGAVRIVGHINNLYNTTFWALIQRGGMDAKEAEKELLVCLVFYFSLCERLGLGGG